jgi:type II secretory pathway pseudopilin PulG
MLALALVVLAVLAAAALPGCGLQDQAVENTSGKIDQAKDAAAKVQLMMIKTGVQAYVATNGSVPADASQATLGSFVAPWPVNPFTDQPMTAGDTPGDYVYTPGAGTAYTLAVHLSDGSTYAAP